MIVIMENTQEKADLQKTEVDTTKQERFVWTEINCVLGKNKGLTSSTLEVSQLLWSSMLAGR